MKDWTGNSLTMRTTLGASNLAEHERAEHDYYATPPRAGDDLIRIQPDIRNIWEPAVGQGHLAKGLGDRVIKASDLVQRPHFETGELPQQLDFLQADTNWDGWIVTNPPFKYAKEFALKANDLASEGVALFLRIQFLESIKRQELFEKYPPKYVYVYSKRCPQCALNGDFTKPTGNATTYCWFVWLAGSQTEPIVRWIIP